MPTPTADADLLEEVLRAILDAVEAGLDGDCDEKHDALSVIRDWIHDTFDLLEGNHASE